MGAMPFSNRLPRLDQTNALTRRLAALAASGGEIIDLTQSNPTRAAIPYPAGLLGPLADSRALEYVPHPFGLISARAAVAADHQRRGVHVDAGHVVLTASTSEAYTWLFKLLCSPGESVLVPRPSYPLFEHLTQLEGVRAHPYELEFHGRWHVDFAAFDSAPADTRAVLVVTPNNPTGSFLSHQEVARLSELCRERRWVLVADEVFADYAIEADAPFTDLAPRADACLTFTLGGFSKTLGLPQLKLGWIVAGGPAGQRDAALAAIELIADSFLSVGTPVQVAAPSLLTAGAGVRAAIRDRVRDNLVCLRQVAAAYPAADVMPVEGGWSAVIRVPATRNEEEIVLDLLETERILAHPGYFFDFPREAFLVVSLLVQERVFADAIPRLLRSATV
jgi:alanine-synthesizing transaminase